ncbi:type II restriction endonuclease [Lacticaseibacillus paracasei]|uniref:type II restriction endonuclease n=1 Tax=Lacticaseibacillus paracasei TaxID=1597 RepID=UPI000FF0D4D6|nr:type II restriction endonuclease [Lacticaseibacillus paracasei]RND79888.1 Type-2 restriction enzyme EcoRII [Lacticaseibacillus paracasei]
MATELCNQAVVDVESHPIAYTKFMSANDSGETKAHQSGILLGNVMFGVFFEGDRPKTGAPIRRKVEVVVQGDQEDVRELTVIYYPSKTEMRITGWGRGDQFILPEYTGSLFVLVAHQPYKLTVYRFDTDDTITDFLAGVGIDSTQTNSIIGADHITKNKSLEEQLQDALQQAALELMQSVGDFPTTTQMSQTARQIEERVLDHTERITKDPDSKIVSWTNVEYLLFKFVEQIRYCDVMNKGFNNVEDFVAVANSILNRRKSRAGKGFESHVAAILDGNQVHYTPQAITEEHKKPDFIFPSIEKYKLSSFPVAGLTSLAVKTTCKDRWRQVITEADRLKNSPKYLLTLQQGISKNQLREMESENVQLIVPKEYLASYPPEYKAKIMKVSDFVELVRDRQSEYVLW